MRDFRATKGERLASEIRYFRRWCLGDLAAALATAGILILAPIMMALWR